VVSDLSHAGAGAAVWLLVALAAGNGAIDLILVDVLLLLAPLVLVPVGLVAGRPTTAGCRGCGWPQPPGSGSSPGSPSLGSSANG